MRYHGKLATAWWVSAVAFSAAMVSSSSSIASAQEIEPAREYQACLVEAQSQPEKGFERALAWAGLGGGARAQHCAAVALFGMGQYGESAVRFERLAGDVAADAANRGNILAQAAQAWLLAGKPGRADTALTTALQLLPDNVELLIDRAHAAAARGGYPDAVRDLSRAHEIDPSRAETLVFRASANRHLDRLDAAAADLLRALSIDSRQPEGLLERGILRRLRGDNAGARRDWLMVLEIAPDSPAAEMSRTNLQKMDGPNP